MVSHDQLSAAQTKDGLSLIQLKDSTGLLKDPDFKGINVPYIFICAIRIKRTAIRTISTIEQNPKYSKFNDALGTYKKQIEKELYDQCTSRQV